MTPCEKIGLKVGDKIRVLQKGRVEPVGSVLTLIRDDGSKAPLFVTESGDATYFGVMPDPHQKYLPEGKGWERVVDEEHSLHKQLRYAITKRDKQAVKAKRHAEKLEQREAEVQRLVGELEREIEDVTGLPCSIGGLQISETIEELRTIPGGVDVDDPMTWQEGDIIECVHAGESRRVTPGKEYVFKCTSLPANVRVNKDDCDQEWGIHNSAKFRFVRRPS